MASGDIAKELNSQLKAKANNDSSEAEKITVVESTADATQCATSGDNQKSKKKEGFLKRFKNVVKAPLKRKSRSGAQENGKSKLMTKSTSDLVAAQGDDADTPHDSKTKHGIAGFFGRQLKIRSSWKKRMHLSKKDEPLSEPGSPLKSRQSDGSPVKQMDSKEREELANINKTLADDSFFQISLTNDTLDSTVLSDGAAPLADFGALEANTSGLSQQNVAQDKIRLAPKGRRKPTRFASKTDASDKQGEKKSVTSNAEVKTAKPSAKNGPTEAVENASKDVEKVSPPIAKNQPKAEKPKIVAKKPMLPVKKESLKRDLVDAAVIQNSTGENSQRKLSAPTTEDLGSWEHIAVANSQEKSPEKEPVKDAKVPDCKEEAVKEEEEENTDHFEQEMNKENMKTSVAEKEVKESKNKGQDILDLIEGKAEKPSFVASTVKKEETEKKEETVMVNGSDFNITSSSPRDKEEKGALDALTAKIRRFSEDQVAEPNEDKREEKITTSQFGLSSTSKNNWSFELDELDDMRSTDLQPRQFQRSKSLSAVQNPSQTVFSKSTSIDGGFKYVEDKKPEEVEITPENSKVPDWVAIAKAKHQKNAPEDGESLEDTMEDIQEIAAQIARNESSSSPEVKEKPSTLSSRIPKPAFKSQSLKHPSPSQAPSTTLKSRNTIASRVTSPTSTCLVCTKPAYQFERCDVDGQVIHKNCAKCSMCSRTINVGTIRVINQKLYCGIHARTAAS